MEISNLIKKQEEEFDAYFEWSNVDGITYHETDSNIKFDEKITDLHRLKNFIKKVRKETAEAVCDKMIGKVLKNDIMSWNDRVITEQVIKKQIIESL